MTARGSSSRPATLAKWRERFLVIHGDVQDLVIQRHIYREVIAIATAIPEVDEYDQTVFEWMIKMHAHSAAVAVRKQDDADRRSVSLRRLLEVIEKRPKLLDRNEYVARSKPDRDPSTELGAAEAADRRQFMNQRFDGLAGVGAAHPSAAAIRADLAKLNAAAGIVRPYVNLTIAHRGRRVLRHPPTWKDLDAAIDLLEQLTRKYNELLDAGQAPVLVPTWQYDWKAIFRIPWLAGGRSSR